MAGRITGTPMTDDSESKIETGAARPRKRATVIEGEAKEIPSASESAAAESASAKQPDAKPDVQAKPSLAVRGSFDWRIGVPMIAVAALSGVSAGLFGAWLFSAASPQSADSSAINNSIAQLSSRLTQQETKTAPPPDLTPLNERSAKLETATGELRGELAEVKKLVDAQANAPTAAELNAVNRRLAQIEEKVGTLAALPKTEPKGGPQPSEVIALSALRDAVATGAPFVGELSAVRALLKDRAVSLAPLDRFAKEGLPTVAALAIRFEPLASKLASGTQPAPESGVFTRLWNNAGKLVEVRPVGEPKGSDAGAVVARMEAKLARGDLSGALEESKALPQSAREQAKDWFDAAEQRRDADAAIKSLINAALAAISAESPKQ